MSNFNDKSKAAYNKKADNYDNTLDGKLTLKFKRLLVQEAGLSENCHVLDVACGNGTLLAMLNTKIPINGFGIDISDGMIKNAATVNPDMTFRVAGCESIPFEDETMDIITVSAAYHHFPDTAIFAKEANRVLKPDGKIYIAEIYLPSVLRLIINPFVPLSRDGDVKFYSPTEITSNFESFCFERTGVKILGLTQIISMKKVSP